MKTSEQIALLKKAYDMGAEHAAAGYYKSWYTTRLDMAYKLGHEGIKVDFDHVVSCYRYGSIPTRCSRNYMDDRLEIGVSIAAIEGEKETPSCIWFQDRDIVKFKALLIGETGSDGERLVIPLDMDEQYDF